MEDIISHWRKFNPNTKPYLHPLDEVKIDVKNHHGNIDSHQDLINLKDYGKKESRDKNKLHLNLLPEPYSGDILNASIYILLLNPGYSNSNYYEEIENCSDFRNDFINTIHQKFNKNEEYPLIWLNPKYLWTSGSKWTERKFKPIIEHLVKDKQYTYVEALKLISKKAAILELSPYHSDSFGLKKSELEAKSIKMMRKFVKKTLIPRATNNNACIIQTRSIKEWDLQLEKQKNKNIIVYDRYQRRSASLSEQSAMDKIIEFI